MRSRTAYLTAVSVIAIVACIGIGAAAEYTAVTVSSDNDATANYIVLGMDAGVPQAERSTEIVKDDYAMARQIASWKKHVRREWSDIQVLSISEPQTAIDLSEKNKMVAEVVLALGDLNPEDVGAEIIFAQTDNHGKLHIVNRVELEVVECKDGVAKYAAAVLPEKTGAYQVGGRIFAKNALLPHRQDFECVKWL